MNGADDQKMFSRVFIGPTITSNQPIATSFKNWIFMVAKIIGTKRAAALADDGFKHFSVFFSFGVGRVNNFLWHNSTIACLESCTNERGCWYGRDTNMNDERQATLANLLDQNTEQQIGTTQLIEKINALSFASEHAQTALLLLVSEAVQLQPTGVTINVELAKLILRAAPNKGQETKIEQRISVENNRVELSEAFQAAIESMVGSEVLPPVFADQVQRLLAIDDLRSVDGAYARFIYHGDGFPKSDHSRGYIEVGDQVIALYVSKIEQAAQQHGVKLTTQQSQRIATQLVLMHEYGHAVLQTKKAIKLAARTQQSGEIKYEDIVAVHNEVSVSIADQIAVAPDLKAVFTAESADELQTVDERVASGFEIVALWNGLQEVGLSHDQLEAITQAYMQEKKDQFEEKKRVVAFMTEKGMSLQQLDQAMEELFFALYPTDPAIAEKCRGGFGPRTMGYSFPLSPSELTRLCKDET